MGEKNGEPGRRATPGTTEAAHAGGGRTTVRELLKVKLAPRILTIAPDRSVYDALTQMAEADVGALIVIDGDRAVGVISERDYARKIILIGKTSRETAVREIMSAPPITVGLDTTVAACMRIMTDSHVRHIPVVDLWEVVGCVSIGDVVKAIIEEQERRIGEYESYITGSYPT